MRKIKEVLRLKWDKDLSNRQIARICGIGRPTVKDYLRRAAEAGLAWPLPSGLDETALERQLFPPPPSLPAHARGVPNWSVVHQELRSKKSVTLFLLWQEYRETHLEGYQYSWFCEHYRNWRGKLDVVMRQDHRAGEKLFVDYAGQTVPVVDKASGEIREAQIFIAVLGASNYTYAEATWSQGLPDWIGSHVRTFAFLGGVPELVVPDNLRAGVSKAHRYEPDTNPTYQDMASHYGVAVLPTRVRRPRDKAKVEAGVLVVERWILAVLRHRVLLLPGRTQCGHPCVTGKAQRPTLQATAGLSPGTLREPRSAGAATLAGGTLRVCRMEEGTCAHRLPRGGGRTLLLGAPCPDQETTGCAHHPEHHRAAFTGATVSPVTGAPIRRDAIRRSRPICPSHTARRATGHPSGCPTGPRRPGRPPKNSSRPC